VVRDELSRLGATSQIVTSAKGETELLVQTGDNTKEPQNRRTTIDLQ
jgi:outer membrane protein OmpA-like peptidoglycan-associated protein